MQVCGYVRKRILYYAMLSVLFCAILHTTLLYLHCRSGPSAHSRRAQTCWLAPDRCPSYLTDSRDTGRFGGRGVGGHSRRFFASQASIFMAPGLKGRCIKILGWADPHHHHHHRHRRRRHHHHHRCHHQQHMMLVMIMVMAGSWLRWQSPSQRRSETDDENRKQRLPNYC